MESKKISSVLKQKQQQRKTVNPKFYIQWRNPLEMEVKKTFPAKKNREFITRRVTVEDMLKEVLQDREKWYHRETWNFIN